MAVVKGYYKRLLKLRMVVKVQKVIRAQLAQRV